MTRLRLLLLLVASALCLPSCRSHKSTSSAYHFEASDTLTVTDTADTSHVTDDTLTVKASAMESLDVEFTDSGGVAIISPSGEVALRGLRSLRRARAASASLAASHSDSAASHSALTASASSQAATSATDEATETTETPMPKWAVWIVIAANLAILLWLLRQLRL